MLSDKLKNFFLKLEVLIFDVFAFNFAFFIAWWLRPYIPFLTKPDIPLVNYREIIILANFVVILVFFLLGFYRKESIIFDVDRAYKILRAIFFASLIIIAVTYLSRTYSYSRFVIVATFIFSVLLIFLGRFIVYRQLCYLKRHGFEIKNTLIIGAGVMGQLIVKKIKKKKDSGYRLIGFLDDDPQKIGKNFEGLTVLGNLQKFEEIVKKENVKEVFVALPATAQQKIMELVMKYETIEFKIVPNLLEVITEPISFSEFKDIPLITVKESSIPLGYDQLKRIFDFLVSFILLILLSPLFVLIMLFVKLTSSGPIFFCQERVGLGKKFFTCYKFRSMYEGAEKIKSSLDHLNIADGPIFKIPDDPRVTPFGRFLRRFCLDELPQLINVLKGEMSLVGPRPPLVEEFIDQPSAWPDKRFSVRPGMTGLWQVSGRHELNFSKAVRLDLYYIKHRSFLFDLEIILKTIPAILFSS